MVVDEGFGGCAVAEGGMQALPVVEHFDVFGDSEPGTGPVRESVPVVHFVFQRGEE